MEEMLRRCLDKSGFEPSDENLKTLDKIEENYQKTFQYYLEEAICKTIKQLADNGDLELKRKPDEIVNNSAENPFLEYARNIGK